MHRTIGTTPTTAAIKNKLAGKNNADFAEFIKNKELRQSFKNVDVSKRESYKGQNKDANKMKCYKPLAVLESIVHSLSLKTIGSLKILDLQIEKNG